MPPIVTAILIFFAVTGVIGAVAFMLRGDRGSRATERLDQLVGRNNGRNESSADMLLKQAMLEVDKRSMLDKLMPEFFKFTRTFEQADLKMQPSMLFGIALARR